MWAVMAFVVLVTYSWVAQAETYHVSRDGIAGGLSRAVTLLNFPIGLVAIALVLVAAAVLPRRAWLAGAPAIALCATIPWFVDQDDLDARWTNAIPVAGAVIALGLTIAATRRAGSALAPRRPFDGWRLAVAAIVGLVSLPWIAAELGFHFPGDFFMGEEIGLEADGTPIAAVHLGHHHGTDGALLVLTALLLSRVRVESRGLRLTLAGYLGLMLSYGGVNFVQDAWNEQIVKRGWTDAGIPSALLPGVTPVWGVLVVIAVAATLVGLGEERCTSYSAP